MVWSTERLALSLRRSPFTETSVLVREEHNHQLCTPACQRHEYRLLVLCVQADASSNSYTSVTSWSLRYNHRHISQSTCRNAFLPSTRRKLGKVKRLGGRKMVASRRARLSASAFPKGPARHAPLRQDKNRCLCWTPGADEMKNPPTRRTAVRVHTFAARLVGPVLGLACHCGPTSPRPSTNAPQSGPEDVRLVHG
jgi:hypothetical protein